MLLRAHPCTVIASALESGQQLLSTQMRDLPERQRSMQAVFVHSMRLLSPDEHQAFCGGLGASMRYRTRSALLTTPITA